MSKTVMSIKVSSANEIAMATRRTWGFKPTSRIVESKKAYSRKDKSWKKDLSY